MDISAGGRRALSVFAYLFTYLPYPSELIATYYQSISPRAPRTNSPFSYTENSKLHVTLVEFIGVHGFQSRELFR